MIAILNFNGTINSSMLSRYMPVLDYINKKKKIKGLLLIINSGGGDANATEILYNKLIEIGKNKTVYALIEGIGASGAYWLSCSAKKIFAMETSIVGSIGVISMSPDLSEFMDTIGIKMRINKIGKYKDINSPFRKMTDEEEKIYNNIMKDIFLKFKNEVKKRRNYSDEEIDNIATGLVFSAKMGKENHLIDDIGDLNYALNELKKEQKDNKTKNLTPKKPFMSRFISVSFESFIDAMKKF